MHPTHSVAHLVSVTAVNHIGDTADDMKIYEFDRETSADLFTGIAWTHTSPGTLFVAFDEVLAA